ncbi:MAG: hypothetical protein V1738_00505 [Patescibacteria group bacterium]
MPNESEDSQLKPRSDLFGHEAVFALLETALSHDRLAHAYLLTGPKEIGKHNFARQMAQLVLGSTAALESQPDFTLIERGDDPKTGKPRAIIALDQVQDVRRRLSRHSMLGGWQVAIIKDADLLNISAANALLKTLEEPQPKTLLVLTAPDADSVLPTVRSRCQEMRLNRVARATIEQILVERGIMKTQAGLLARLSDGCPMRAVRLAEQPVELTRLRDLRTMALALFGADYAARWRTMDVLLPKKHTFQEAGAVAQDFLDILAEILRDALLIKNGQENRVIHVDVIDSLRRIAGSSSGDLARTIEELYRARKQIHENVGPRGVLQNFVVTF